MRSTHDMLEVIRTARLFRFSIRDILWLTVVCALVVTMVVHRDQVERERQRDREFLAAEVWRHEIAVKQHAADVEKHLNDVEEHYRLIWAWRNKVRLSPQEHQMLEQARARAKARAAVR
jgi:hypothetical protein